MRLEHLQSLLYFPGLPDLCNASSPQGCGVVGWVLTDRGDENRAG